MLRRAVAKSVSRPVRPAKPPPRHTAAELDEIRIRMLVQVERIQAANVWNNRLATEFEEAEAEMDVVKGGLDLDFDTFPTEALRTVIAELEEEVRNIAKSHLRLRIEVSELELGAASLKGLVSGLLEAIKLINDSSSALGELLEQLQQELADACVEFETRVISMAHVTAPVVEPAVESSVGSPVESCQDSRVLNPVLDSAPLGPDLDPVPPDRLYLGSAAPVVLDPVLDPAPLDPVSDPVTLDPVLDPVVLDPVMDPVPSNPVLDPVALDPVLDPRPPVPPDPVDLRSPASVLDPVLDPTALDPDLDPVVSLNPILDSPALDPVSDPRPPVPPDPVDLSFDLDLCDPDPEPHWLWSRSRSPTPSPVSSGPVPEPRCSPCKVPVLGR
jgi:hypothetical protein